MFQGGKSYFHSKKEKTALCVETLLKTLADEIKDRLYAK